MGNKKIVKPKTDTADYSRICNVAGAVLIAYWRLYPDRLLQFMESENPDYTFNFIQSLLLRVLCRNQEVFVTGGRGLTKSYTLLMSRKLLGILYPGIYQSYFGPAIKQVAGIIAKTDLAIIKNYTGLKPYWHVFRQSVDRYTTVSSFGSTIDVDMMRGTNAHSVAAEEVAQQEGGEAFDHEKFRAVVLPAVRIQRMVNRKQDNSFPNIQKCYVTSAGRKQNPAFEYRCNAFRRMCEGERAFEIDIPAEVAVISGIRPLEWYNEMKAKLTPEEWLREMSARWTGSEENPLIRDSTIAESRNLTLMEDRHCGDKNAIYIVGYDVSYAEGKNNAKCATSVIKMTAQKAEKGGRYLKDVVYCLAEPPANDALLQARKIKARWYRFCMENGAATYLVIDARAYGTSVIEDLHKDIGDGLPPLCCVDHSFPALEREGALPVIYPVSATGMKGTKDRDSDMIKYAELEWEHRNVRLLVNNVNEGVEAYKKAHKIKDDMSDATIAIPYQMTRLLVGQIANLKKDLSGDGIKERRISLSIQRDIWSATKYALWFARKIELQEEIENNSKTSEWQQYIDKLEERRNVANVNVYSSPTTRGTVSRKGGNQWK